MSVECIWPDAQNLLDEDGRRRRTSVITSSMAISNSRSRPVAYLSENQHRLYLASNCTANNPRESSGITDVQWIDSIIELQSNWTSLPVELPPGGNGSEELFTYFSRTFLPSLTHEYSHPRYRNHAYWINLAKANRPLMEAALACSAMSISHKISPDPQTVPQLRQRALIHQTVAITIMRQAIESGTADGTGDWLLATVILLTLFDNRDPSCPASSGGTHVRAIIQLLKCRQASKIQSRIAAGRGSEDPRVVFERICYESLLYHGTIMMIYDRNFDALVGFEAWQMIDEYFGTCLLPVDEAKESWPVLGVPYNLFRIIVAVSRLSRRRPLTNDDLAVASIVSAELTCWVDLLASNPNSPGKLYVLAAKILLEDVLSQQPEGAHLTDSVLRDIGRFMYEMTTVEVRPQVSRYNLWPLSVLEHIAKDTDDKRLVKNKIAQTIQMLDGGGVMEVPQELLERYADIPGIR